MLSIKKISVVLLLLGMLGACKNDPQSPGYEYMPDMYRSPSIKTFEANGMFKDSLSALQPVAGTIPRGFMEYDHLPNTPDGYELSKTALQMPQMIMNDSLSLADGGKLYGIFCAQCHGKAGDGQGVLVQNGKYLGVPSYADRVINYGSIFYVVTNGKGVMGSHAAQLKPEERWKIALHVMKLKQELSGESTAPAETGAPADSTAMAMN